MSADPGSSARPAAEHESNDAVGHASVSVFELFVLVLTVIVLAARLARQLFDLPDHARESLGHLDNAVCLIFLIDFASCMWRAPDRLRYVARTGWIDFVGSLPGVGVLRWGRAVRAVQIARVARQMFAHGTVLHDLRRQLPNTVLLGMVLVGVLLLGGASLAIVQLEHAEGGNIRTGGEALWWSIVTMTTVGYGDYYPQSPGGRILAVALMTVGVAVFGAFTSYLGSAFMRSRGRGLAGEVARLREQIDRLEETLSRSQDERRRGD